MNHKLQYVIAILITITFIAGVSFSATILLRNNKIIEDHIKFDNRCAGDSLKIIMLEKKLDSLLHLKKKVK